MHGLCRHWILLLLHSLAFSSSARAALPRGVNGTSSHTRSSPKALVTAEASCPLNCTIAITGVSTYEWVSLTYVETVTAATIVHILNNATNTTRTSTIYNDLPSGYTHPATDAAGYKLEPVTLTSYLPHNKTSVITTTLTYPAGTTLWPPDYYYAGVLPTIHGSKSSCRVATSTTDLPLPTDRAVPPIPSGYADANYSDYGIEWSIRSYPLLYITTYDQVFTSEPAFRLCSMYDGRVQHFLPETFLNTASLMTVTSTSHEAGYVSPTPKPFPASSPAALQTTSLLPVLSPGFLVTTSLVQPIDKTPSPNTISTSTATQGLPVTSPEAQSEILGNLPISVTTPNVAAAIASIIGASQPQATAPKAPNTALRPNAPTGNGDYTSATLTLHLGGPPPTLGPGPPSTTVAFTTDGVGHNTVLVVDGSTSLLPSQPIIIASDTFSINAAGEIMIGTKTLTPGQTETLEGSGTAVETVVLTTNSAGESAVVVDGTTEILPSASREVESGVSATPTQGAGSGGGTGGGVGSATATANAAATAVLSTASSAGTVHRIPQTAVVFGMCVGAVGMGLLC